MARSFIDAKAMLNDLLDRFESGAASPIAHPDYTAFASVVTTDAFLKEVHRAEQAGAVIVGRGRGMKRDQVAHVRLAAPETLYRYLGRVPAPEAAQDAGIRLIAGLKLDPGLVDAASKITASWSRAKTWNGFSAEDVDKLRGALELAQAVLDGKHIDVDYRTFSRRITGESKALERVESAVVRLIVGIRDLPPEARPREALRTLGLERFAPPLLMSGRIDLEDADLSGTSLTYLGIAPKEAGRVRFREPPAYILTIENFASFNRHVIEADPGRLGTTMYVGGYPSLATQQALHQIADALPETTPIFHWSDIDPDGTWIFHTIERAIGRFIRPHLMSVDIAEKYGKSPLIKGSSARCPVDSGIFPLAEYLAKDGAKTLEQEELDPQIPSVGA
jgi:Wadjet protein JetD, C-terminal